MSKLVVVEVMPSCWIESHRAAGNFGRYPQNGAARYVTTREWAEDVTAGNEYDHIVRDASDDDVATHEALPELW